MECKLQPLMVFLLCNYPIITVTLALISFLEGLWFKYSLIYPIKSHLDIRKNSIVKVQSTLYFGAQKNWSGLKESFHFIACPVCSTFSVISNSNISIFTN